MRIVWYVTIFAAGLVFGYLMWASGVVDFVDRLPGNETEPEISVPTYLSFVSVMMTTVTVVLAAVAIGIGVVAAYTIKEITESADSTVKVAREKAEASKAEALALVEKALSDDSINARLDKIVRANQGPSVAELEKSFDPEDDGNR